MSTGSESAPGLVIRVSRGVGSGPTRMAAFDAALRQAGLQGFNLLRLSSIIPGGSSVEVVSGTKQISGEFGDAVFTVYAEAYATVPGEQACAGVGWALRTDGSGAGLFVEQNGATREQVEHGLTTTLTAMSQGRTDEFALAGRLLSSIPCQEEPVAAVVVATYRRMSWSAPGEVAAAGPR